MTKNGVSLLIDAMSYQYLVGAEIDYKGRPAGRPVRDQEPWRIVHLRLRFQLLDLKNHRQQRWWNQAGVNRSEHTGPGRPLRWAGCRTVFPEGTGAPARQGGSLHLLRGQAPSYRWVAPMVRATAPAGVPSGGC